MPASGPPDEQLLKQALKWFFLLQSEHCTDKDRRKFNRWFCKMKLIRQPMRMLNAYGLKQTG